MFTNITDANECIPSQANYKASYVMSNGANNCPVKPSIITTYKRNTDRYTQVCVPSGIGGLIYKRYGTLDSGETTWSSWSAV